MAVQESLEAWGGQLRWNDPPPPSKIEKNKFVLKCILGNFQYFQPMVFLVENLPIRPPPLLVENSIIFIFKLSLIYKTEPKLFDFLLQKKMFHMIML